MKIPNSAERDRIAEKIFEILYLFLFVIFMWIKVIEHSRFEWPFPDEFRGFVRAMMIGVLFLRLFWNQKEGEEKKKLFICIMTATLFAISFAFSLDVRYIDTAIVLLGTCNMPYRRLLKIYLLIAIIGILTCLYGATAGMSGDVMNGGAASMDFFYLVREPIEDYTGVRFSHSLGFGSSVFLARIVFEICMAVWILHKRKKGYWFSLIFAGAAVGLYFLTQDLQTVRILCLAAGLSALSYVLNTKRFWKTKQSMILRGHIIRILQESCIGVSIAFLILMLYLRGIGGGDYVPTLKGNLTAILALAFVHGYLSYRAREYKNGNLMMASGLQLLYSAANLQLWNPLMNIFLFLAFADYSQKSKVREATKMDLVAAALAVAAFALSALPWLLQSAVWRTASVFRGFHENPSSFLCIAVGYSLAVLAGTAGIYQTIAFFGEDQKRKQALSATGTAIAILVIIVIGSFPGKAAKEETKEYAELLADEYEILEMISIAGEVTDCKVYVEDIPAFYQQYWPNIETRIFWGLNLLKEKNIAFLTDGKSNLPIYLQNGFYHMMLTPEHALYSNSEDFLDEMRKYSDFAKSNCYSGYHQVDLREMAKINDIELTEEDKKLVCTEEEYLLWGPYLHLQPGVYKVNFKLRWDPDSIKGNYTVAKIWMTTMFNEYFYGETYYNRDDLGHAEEITLSMIGSTNEDFAYEFHLMPMNGAQFTVEEITWQQLWVKEAESEKE